ncbi:MAG TPA: diguanylate cyclase [Bacillus sp. (in: firmicutes)]|nr:diguanylate cyclase [Bacillus sp. (in: firmicutes)]
MLFSLLSDLIVNLAIFTSTTVLIHYILKKGASFKDIYDLHPRKLTTLVKLKIGLIDGVIGSVIMFYGIDIGSSGTLVDLRHLPIMISSLFGGLPSGLTAGGIVAVSRIVFFSDFQFTVASNTGAINAVNMAIGCSLISHYAKGKRKWLFMNIYCLVSITIVAFIVIKDVNKLLLVVTLFWIISIISAFWIFCLLNYLLKSNAMQQTLIQTLKELKDMKYALDESAIVTIADNKGRITYVNDKFCEASEFRREELIGKDHRIMNSGYHSKEFFKQLWDTISRGAVWKGEIKNRSKSGKTYWFDTTIVPFLNNEGIPYQYVSIRTDTTQRKKAENQLRYLSNIDGLTQIANRRYFDQALEMEWQKSIQEGKPISLLLFDIDYFKKYNDKYGHQSGDECLKKIAGVLKNVIDHPSDVIARYGGEEFAIILPQTDKEGAVFVAEKIRQSVEALRIPHAGSKMNDIVTISMGAVSLVATVFEQPGDLIAKADKALYQAKNEGRNRVRIYETVF